MSGKTKTQMLAHTVQLTQEIRYFKSRIEESRLSFKSTIFDYEQGCDSDSDGELIPQFDTGSSIADLKLQTKMLKTCLEATLELSALSILDYGDNILVDAPLDLGRKQIRMFEHKQACFKHIEASSAPVTEPGVWHEIIAECRLDLINFSMVFYVHKPYDDFAPLTFNGLQVSLTKKLHKDELSASILPSLTKPSDAVEVIRGYAEAYRSRRTTLARLANKYSDMLHIEQLSAGGFLVRCANVLELQWTLENRSSPTAPFHHHTKSDLEYIEQEPLNLIRVVHKKLSDPFISTDERTQYLGNIIDICLEATPNNYEGQSSEAETAQKLEERRMTLDMEPEEPPSKRTRPSEEMAPPRSLPKKVAKAKKSVTHESTKLQKNNTAVDKDSTTNLVRTEVEKASKSKDNENVNTVSSTDKVRKDPKNVKAIENKAESTKKRHAAGKENIDINKQISMKEKEGNDNEIKESNDVRKSSVAKSSSKISTAKQNVENFKQKAGNKIDNAVKPSTSKDNQKTINQTVKNNEAKKNKRAPTQKPVKEKAAKKRPVEDNTTDNNKKRKTVDNNNEKEKDKKIERVVENTDAKKKQIEDSDTGTVKKIKSAQTVGDVIDNNRKRKTFDNNNDNGKDKITEKVVQKKDDKTKQIENSDTAGTVKKIKSTNPVGNVQKSTKNKDKNSHVEKTGKTGNVTTGKSVKETRDATDKNSKSKAINKDVVKNKVTTKPSGSNTGNPISKVVSKQNIQKDKISNVASTNKSAGRTNVVSNQNVKKSVSETNIQKNIVNKDSKVVKKVVSDTDIKTEVVSSLANQKDKENTQSNKPQIKGKTTTMGKESTVKQPVQNKPPLKTLNKPKAGNTNNAAGKPKTVASKEKENAEVDKQNLVKSKLPMSKLINNLPSRVSPRKSISKCSTNIKKPSSLATTSSVKAKSTTNIPRLLPKQTKT